MLFGNNEPTDENLPKNLVKRITFIKFALNKTDMRVVL